MIAQNNELIALMPKADLLTLVGQSTYDMAHVPDLLDRVAALSPLVSSSDDYVDSGMVWHLLASIGYEVDDEFLGLSTHRVPPGSTELMIARAMQEPTLGEAIRAFAHSVNILWPDVHAEAKIRLDELHFSMSCKGEYLEARQIFLEIACIPFYCIFEWLADSRFPVLRFRLDSNRPSGAVHQLAVLDCGVQFEGSGVNIVLPRNVESLATSKRKLAGWQPEIYQIFLDILEKRKKSFSTLSLQSYVMKALRCGIRSQQLVAASAGISVATLRRNLAMERTSFSEISDHVFRETVAMLIAHGEPVEAIAVKMGYADARSFRRAFQRVFGVNPSTFRKDPLSVLV
ncbi:MAG: AraC family transcriptional regulator ligand-binding domain-containing protein [Parvibaculaceae bacterium]